MTQEQRDDLRRLAEAAVEARDKRDAAASTYSGDQSEDNAWELSKAIQLVNSTKFACRAAADPTTILALLDALDEAEQAWQAEHDAAVTARAERDGEHVWREAAEKMLQEKCNDCELETHSPA